MNPNEVTVAEAEQTQQPADNFPPSALVGVNESVPFVPSKLKPGLSLKDNGRLFFIASGMIVVCLLLTIGGFSRRSPQQNGTRKASNPTAMEVKDSVTASATATPILDWQASSNPEPYTFTVSAEELQRLEKPETPDPEDSRPRTLGDIRPFENGKIWQPVTSGRPPAAFSEPEPQPAPAEPVESRDVHERLEKTSLIFVQKVTPKVEQPMPQLAVGIGLAPGTKLRAKLESAVSTAVHSPAVAVIEYNYERDGQILIPAGAKAFGQLEMADRSGYVGIHFNSLLMPDGTVLGVEAIAADLHLQPLRGRVEGRHAGRNILVRSLAGMGEITATVLGRGSLNQPLSEGDLFRERISSNIGQAADQSLNNSALTEQSVISVLAGTELYIILQKFTMEHAAQPLDSHVPDSRVSISKTAELRQLLQLQRELNDTQPSQ